MNKKTILILLFLLVISSVFAISSSALVGTWTYEDKEEECKYTKIFTKDGFFVFEEEGEYGDYYDFGKYTVDEDTLDIEWSYFDIRMEGKTLYIDDVPYKKSSSKATNNSSKISGVWTNDYYLLGLAKDGLAISMGAYMNIGDYTTSDNEITIDEETSRYIIVNDCLYIENFDFFHEYYTIKLKRQASSTGENQTKKTILVKQPWVYSNTNSVNNSETEYTFKANGNFVRTDYVEGKKTGDYKGTYTMDGSRIHLSNGTFVAFALIDGTVISYTVN